MRILVTGREGQVARSLAERGLASGHEIVLLGRPQFDLAGDPEAIVEAVVAAQPDSIVSAAAYTAVDKAESEPELAFAINEIGAGAVASAARQLHVPIIHLSTDYVFDGSKSSPYREDDPTSPKSIYGASKLAGEKAVVAAHGDAAILRTSWVYSPFGSNFVKTMLRLAQTRQEVGVVADQHGNPTSALDIADAVLTVAETLVRRRDPALRGIFHMAGTGAATWADLAEAIFEVDASLGGPRVGVRRIATADYPTPAQRPANSRLDSSKLAQFFDVRLPEWRASVVSTIERIRSAPPGPQAEINR